MSDKDSRSPTNQISSGARPRRAAAVVNNGTFGFLIAYSAEIITNCNALQAHAVPARSGSPPTQTSNCLPLPLVFRSDGNRSRPA